MLKSWMLTINFPGFGCDEILEEYIVNYFKLHNHIYCYVVETQNVSNRHCHFLCIASPNLKELLRKKLVLGKDNKKFPYISDKNFKGGGLNLKTWYKPSDRGNAYDYLLKEEGQEIIYSENYPEEADLFEMLEDNKEDKDRRSNKWHTMVTWQEKFEKNKLPYGTWEEVEKGVSNLCFVHKVAQMPQYRQYKELVSNLHMYMTGYEGSVFEYMEELNDKHILKRRQDALDRSEVIEGRVLKKVMRTQAELEQECSELDFRGRKATDGILG